MDIVDQIVADMHAVMRIFAGTTASVLKNAWMRLAKAGVLGESHQGEVFEQSRTTQLSELLFPRAVGNNSEFLPSQLLQARCGVIVSPGQVLVFMDKDAISVVGFGVSSGERGGSRRRDIGQLHDHDDGGDGLKGGNNLGCLRRCEQDFDADAASAIVINTD